MGRVSQAERSGISPGNTQSGDRHGAGAGESPRLGVLRAKYGVCVSLSWRQYRREKPVIHIKPNSRTKQNQAAVAAPAGRINSVLLFVHLGMVRREDRPSLELQRTRAM